MSEKPMGTRVAELEPEVARLRALVERFERQAEVRDRLIAQFSDRLTALEAALARIPVERLEAFFPPRENPYLEPAVLGNLREGPIVTGIILTRDEAREVERTAPEDRRAEEATCSSSR